MAIVTRPGSDLYSIKLKYCSDYRKCASVSNVMRLKTAWSRVQVQLCSLALTGSLFHVIRLPRDAFQFGPVPYLLAFTASSLLVAVPVVLLEIAIGQLTQQDAVGVWRAIPILRGVGYLKIFVSWLCCIYYMVPLTLSVAYVIWIGKGSLPLKDCSKIYMTPDGYENRINASECFNNTFLAPYSAYPQYLGVMAILTFFMWFFIPIALYRLHKTMKMTLAVCVILTAAIAVTVAAAVGDSRWLAVMQPEWDQWRVLLQPNLWHSALVQALLSAHVTGGYLISSGGHLYRKCDVRWTTATIVCESIIAGCIWVMFWLATGGEGYKDTTFVGVLVLIYQTAVKERRPKQWPLLAFSIVFVSGIITVITLLYPVFDRLHRIAGDRWRLIAGVGSALGTALTLAALSRRQHIIALMDEVAVPFLVMFTTALEVVAFTFIYGWDSLLLDMGFLLGTNLRCFWVIGWWTTPIVIVGVTGWWLRSLLKLTWNQPNMSLWPLLGVFVAALAIIVIFAAIAVAKEEQYNLLSKISATFRPSRHWGPEDPLVRYQWMSQRTKSIYDIYTFDGFGSDRCQHEETKLGQKNMYGTNNVGNNFLCKRPYFVNPAFEYDYNDMLSSYERKNPFYDTITNTRTRKEDKSIQNDDKFLVKSTNFLDEVTLQSHCKCKRHFNLRVPHYVNGEITTTL